MTTLVNLFINTSVNTTNFRSLMEEGVSWISLLEFLFGGIEQF